MNPLDIFEALINIKEEAVDKLKKIIQPAYFAHDEITGDVVVVESITISPADSREDLDDDEVFVDMLLTFYINGLTVSQIKDLNVYGKITFIDNYIRVPSDNTQLWDILYETSYGFEIDEEKKVLPGSFACGNY